MFLTFFIYGTFYEEPGSLLYIFDMAFTDKQEVLSTNLCYDLRRGLVHILDFCLMYFGPSCSI